jgi:hypothetical protein
MDYVDSVDHNYCFYFDYYGCYNYDYDYNYGYDYGYDYDFYFYFYFLYFYLDFYFVVDNYICLCYHHYFLLLCQLYDDADMNMDTVDAIDNWKNNVVDPCYEMMVVMVKYFVHVFVDLMVFDVDHDNKLYLVLAHIDYDHYYDHHVVVDNYNYDRRYVKRKTMVVMMRC